MPRPYGIRGTLLAEISLLGGQNSLRRAVEFTMPLGGSLLAVMYTPTEDIEPALLVAKESWRGAMGAYAHTGDCEPPHCRFENIIGPDAYLAQARRWVEMSAHLVGGCCGIGPDHIRLLREELPAQIPTPQVS